MCGIVGLVHKTGRPVTGPEIDHLTDLVSHRGPDGRGTLAEGPVGLGHRRLAIIDLSDDGLQPMHSADGSLSIVFNGEIYNYIELRAELSALGHGFRSHTDTEVILAAYAAWGEDCVRRFNGMWGLAIFDRRRNRLVLSRDRFGVKPLYYVDDPKLFAFGSEIGQLLPLLGERTTDPERVSTFLLTGGLDLDEGTFFNGVKKLGAGSSAIFDLSDHSLTIRPYYLLERTDELAGISAAEAASRYGDLFRDAIKLRMRADVRVGTCLSGGLDSSSVATIASALYGASGASGFCAITAISEDQATDETAYAEKIVANSGLTWLKTRPTYRDFTDSLPTIVASQQEPFGSPSLTMQYFVMKTARDNGVKVLLDGQAGDETLFGYEKYYFLYLKHLLRQGGWGAVLSGLRAMKAANQNMSVANILKFTLGAGSPRIRMLGHRRLQPSLTRAYGTPPHLMAFAGAMSDPFALQQLEIQSTNLPVLLRYEDRNSMAHGIEARLPFMDYRLVEFSLNLPLHYKIREGWTKWILRQSMAPLMPREITWRKNKLAFNAPDRLWLGAHHQEMRALVLGSSLIQSVTDRRRLGEGFDRLSNGAKWRLYSVALWQRAFGVSV